MKYLHELLPVLARSHTPDEVMRLFRYRSHWYHVQTALHQALTVAPEDVTSQVHFSASGDGFVWDAAPLLGLITEDDLKRILGDPYAVWSWLTRHHQLPETERPAGLPADLRSPRDLCDLLLNIPLLIWVFRENVPDWRVYEQTGDAKPLATNLHVVSPEQARQENLQHAKNWGVMAVRLCAWLGEDPQAALRMAHRVGVELRQLCDDPETLAEHRRSFFSDPWQLKHWMFHGSV